MNNVLDLKDRKLLYWLDQDSRSTNKMLGKKIGLTEQAVGYKLKRLQEDGIIKRFVTFVNTLALGYTHYKVFVKLRGTNRQIEEQFIKHLVENTSIRWVATTSGRYDISFSVLAQTPSAFRSILQEIEREYHKYLAEKTISINVFSPGFTRDYLLERKQSRQFHYGVTNTVVSIDEADKKILKALSQHARKNVVDIATETGLTIDIVSYRLKKLKEKQVISGFTVQLDLEKLGYEYYTVFLYTQSNPALEKKFIEFAQIHPNVLYVVFTIGNHDAQLEIEVKNYAEFENILKEFREQFAETITNFEILRVTNEHKYDFYPFLI